MRIVHSGLYRRGMRPPREHPEHPRHHTRDAGPAHLLDLDAEIHRAYLDEVTAWVGRHADHAPRTIVDVGAGTGTGTVALARRFPAAEFTAIDRSPAMLDRIGDTVRRAGIDDRVRIVAADLDTERPALEPADLIWAASSLHHLAHPDPLLRWFAEVLAPGGLVTVLETDGHPRFLPDDLGFGTPGLEARCHAAAARQGWNDYPDWGENLARAGLTMIGTRRFEIRLDPPPPRTADHARAVLTGMRHALADALAADDLDTLGRLLGTGPEAVSHRTDLTVTSGRTVWLARRAPSRDLDRNPKNEGTQR